MFPEVNRPDEDEMGSPFGFEPEYVLEIVKKWQERQLPGIDSTAAAYYWRVREILKRIPELKEQLEELPKDSVNESNLEFDKNGYHWKFIANKGNFSGDFRLVLGDEEEEARFILGKQQNIFGYWNKRFAVSGGAKIFRGPNDSAAKKIQSMVEKLDSTDTKETT
ncbi:MAG: hypothetical protein Q7R97_03770 [Candidatus Daviesbacteria bacterium]|nr:hypothetical protein [Candidatus Daviesbacteria bacterium]